MRALPTAFGWKDGAFPTAFSSGSPLAARAESVLPQEGGRWGEQYASYTKFEGWAVQGAGQGPRAPVASSCRGPASFCGPTGELYPRQQHQGGVYRKSNSFRINQLSRPDLPRDRPRRSSSPSPAARASRIRISGTASCHRAGSQDPAAPLGTAARAAPHTRAPRRSAPQRRAAMGRYKPTLVQKLLRMVDHPAFEPPKAWSVLTR